MGLKAWAASRDAALFTGRGEELDLLRNFLAPDSPCRVAFVSGPAGVGKSALLRAIAREADGYDVRDSLGASDRPQLILIDTPLARDDDAIDRALDRLGDESRVIVARPHGPSPSWWGSAWQAITLTMDLVPLTVRESTDLLSRRGLEDPTERAALAHWSEGHALSLVRVAAARAGQKRPLTDADLARVEETVLDTITQGAVGAGLPRSLRLVLGVAALAPAVDAAAVQTVLPGEDGVAAEQWLRSLPFARRVGTRVTLEPRARRLIASTLRRSEPDLERRLRLTLIDHLADEASDGQPHLVLDIREVLDPPQDHGMTPYHARSSAWQIDEIRQGDEADLGELFGSDPALAEWVGRWVREAPRHVVVVRRPDDGPSPVALAVVVTPDTVPTSFAADERLSAWLDWLRGRDDAARALITPIVEVFGSRLDAEEVGQVGAVLLNAAVDRSPVTDFRWWLVPQSSDSPDPAHCGGVAQPLLDLVFDRTTRLGHVIDYGPAGVIAAMRSQALEGLSRERLRVSAEDVRTALREAHDPRAAQNPLVALLPEAMDQAFGAGPEARLLRDVIRLGYLDPESGHAHAMRMLHLSRTTYFRRLREAVSLLAGWFDQHRTGVGA